MSSTLDISPERARIFRITHIDNVPSILEHGVHCKQSHHQNPDFVQIGNLDLIDKRSRRLVPVGMGGTLNDYVPFYFTPFSPMLFNIKTGWNGIQQRPMHEIVLLVSSLRELVSRQVSFVFTDRHAYLQAALFFTNLADLARIDWRILQARDFKRDPNDPGKVERYQAEALVHRHVPVEALSGIVCYGEEQAIHLRGLVSEAGLELPVTARSGWFF